MIMKKGELRKEAILNGAERLFLERGFDETSVQDILDLLSLSKGGFYHYFDSKDALLEEICFRNAAQRLEKLEKELANERSTPVRKLNLILSALNLFSSEAPRFCAVMLKISYIDGDVNFRDHLRSFLFSKLLLHAKDAIVRGVDEGLFFVRNPKQVSYLLLCLGYDISDEISRRLTLGPDEPELLIDLIDLLNAYRDSCETILGAAFGSIEIINVEQLLDAFRQTREYLELYKGERP